MNQKLNIIISGAVLAFVSGIIIGLFTSPIIPLISAFVGLVLVLMWVIIDAREHNFKRSALFNILVVAITVLSVPYYLFKSRGFAKGLLAVIGFFSFMVLWSVVQVMGAAVVTTV
jgi:hypothetical protein